MSYILTTLVANADHEDISLKVFYLNFVKELFVEDEIRMVFTEVNSVRTPMIMNNSNGASDSLSVDINPKLLLINENAPLAKQESLTDIIRHDRDTGVVVRNGDNHHFIEDEVEEELKHIVVVRENPAAEVGVTASGSSNIINHATEATVQISKPQTVVHKIVDESPVNGPSIVTGYF